MAAKTRRDRWSAAPTRCRWCLPCVLSCGLSLGTGNGVAVTRRAARRTLTQQPGQGTTLGRVKLPVAQGTVVVRIGRLEPPFDHGKIFILGQGPVLVGIGGGEFP